MRFSIILAIFFFSSVAQAQITGDSAAEAITRLNQPRDASIVANSVDAGTGAFSMEATVLSVNAARAFEFTALYDSIVPPTSIVARPRSLGLGWTHPFSAVLEGNPNTVVFIWWDDNRRNSYEKVGSNYVPREESAQYDRLIRNGGGDWRITRPDGTEYRFDSDGKLTQIANKIRQKIEVQHDGVGRITKLVEPVTGKQIQFSYPSLNSIRVSHLTDPAGRQTHFIYDSNGRLRALHNPTEFDSSNGDSFVPKAIPDNNPAGLVHTVNVNRSTPMGLLNVDILNLGHQRPNDLTITLTSPQGTSVELQDLLVHPSASALDAQGVVLQEFEGENPQGAWRLTVVDHQAGSTGELNGFIFSLSDRTYPTYLTYNAGRLLLQASDAVGARLFANQYDGVGRVIAQDDGRDDTPLSTFSYTGTPSGGVVTMYTNRNGGQQIFEHDSKYRLLRFIDPLGAETVYTYNGKGERLTIKDPLARVTAFGYDSNGNVITVVDPALNVTQMNYDSEHNLTRFIDAAGNETTFNYSNGNVTRVRDALGHQTDKQYGGNGQLLQNMMDDGAGVQYTYTAGMITGARRMDASGSKIEKTDYDALGFPTSLTDAEGRKTEFEYDERLNVVARTNPLGDVEIKQYDERNRLRRIVDHKGNQTLLTYDGNNNVVARTNALGQTTMFYYDAEDQLNEIVDPLGRTSHTVYDAVGRAVRTIDGVGNVSRREYDVVGNLMAVYDGEDRLVRSVVYDLRDLPVEVVDALGARIQNSYDVLGNLISITDNAGLVTYFRYDKLNRLVEVEDPLGRVLKKEYFSDDVVQAIENAAGKRTTFSYDRANRVRQIEPPAGSIAQVEFNYDEAYQVTQDRLPGGARRDYQYDDGGRLTRISYVGSDRPGNRKMTYDDNGNLLRVEVEAGGLDPSGVQLQREYDALDRVTKFTDVHGTSLRYVYDASGNLTSLTYPDGRVLHYVYNEANQLTEVVDWANRHTQFGYDTDSRITSILFPNGVMRLMQYDAGGRLTSRRDLRSTGAVIVEYSYEYDAQGQVSVESGGPPAPPYLPAAMAMTHLFDGRLATVNGAAVSYDSRHNITSAPLDGTPYDFKYNLNNRLIEVNGRDREYDAADNLIAWDGPGGRTRLSVNPQAGLPQVVLKRDPNGTSHYYVYAGGLLYDEVGGDIRIYHYDYRGNTVAFSNGSGSVVGTVAYGPFGEIIGRSGASDSIFLHGGLWGVITDPQTELQYMRFRWYAPQLKQFLSKDDHVGDITSPASLNRFAYAGNNPISFNDPTGEFLNFIAAAVGAAVGAVVGVAVTVVSKAIKGERITAGDIIGSAVGGAVTGGLVGLCAGVCGPAALIAGGAVAGALGGGAGNLLGQGIDVATGADAFDGNELTSEIIGGAIFGAIPFGGKGAKAVSKGLGRGATSGAARGLTKGSVSKSLRKIATPAGEIQLLVTRRSLGGKTIFPSLASATRSAAADSAAAAARRRVFAGNFLTDMGVGLIQTAFTDLVFGSGSPAPTQPQGAAGVLSASRDEINAGQRGVYGEFSHWRLYQSFHLLTGVPLPNNPNSPLAEF